MISLQGLLLRSFFFINLCIFLSFSVFALSIDDVNINIVQSDPYWQVTHQTGQEENLTVWFANAKDKKTEIGFYITEGKQYTTTDKILQYKDGTPILDDKNKPITLKYETAKCDGINCYYISLTNAQAININDTIKLGDNSLVLEYKETQSIQYVLDNQQFINVTLYKNIGGIWNNSIDNIYTYTVNDSLKFGAIDLDNTGIETYKYTFISNKIPIEANNESIIWKQCDSKKFGSNCNQTAIFFNDIVEKPFVVSVNYSEIIQDELYIGEITFNSDADIDPKLSPGTVTGCGYIDQSGTYVLNTNISNSATTCIEINASNVDFSCAPNIVIDGTSGFQDYAIYAHSIPINNITIHSCTIEQWDGWINYAGNNYISNSHIYNINATELRNGASFGIEVYNNTLVHNLNLANDINTGVLIYPTNNNNTIYSNTLDCNAKTQSVGINLGYQSDTNNIFNNTISNCISATRLTHLGQNNNIFNNTFLSNSYIIEISGINAESATGNTFYNNIFSSNNYILNTYNSFTLFNTTPSNNTNILGKQAFGGNFYTNSIYYAYSNLCIDNNNDFFCDNSFNLSSKSECTTCTGRYIDNYPLTYNNAPVVNYFGDTPTNDSITSDKSFLINASINASDIISLSLNFNETFYTIINSSLLSYYNFDNRSSLGDSSSLATDIIGHNNATLVNAIYGTGKSGMALSMDGTGDYATLGTFDELFTSSPSFSICAWVYLNTIGTTDNNDDSAIFSQGSSSNNNILFWYNVNAGGTGDQVYSFNAGDASVSNNRINGVTKATAQTWEFVCATKRSSAIRLYLNGVQDASGFASTTSLAPNSETARAGSWSLSSTLDFDGKIDNLMIFNHVLSASDIMNLYHSTLTKYAPNDYVYDINVTNATGGNLLNGTYTYLLNATNSTGTNIINDRYLTIGTVIPPTITQNITQIENLTNSSKTNDSIYITWDKSQIPSNTSLYLDNTFIANVTTTSYNFTGLTPNTQYTITGYAFNATTINLSISIENNISVFTLNTTLAPAIPQNVTQIENLTNISSTNTSIYIIWNYTAISNASIYLDGSYYENVSYPINFLNLSPLSPNTTYTITAYAFNATTINLSISIENNISANTRESPPPLPSGDTQIENLTYYARTNQSISIVWNYTVFSNASIYVDAVNIINITYPTNTYVISGLMPSTVYNITLYAYNNSFFDFNISSENNIFVSTLANPSNASCSGIYSVDIQQNYAGNNLDNITIFSSIYCDNLFFDANTANITIFNNTGNIVVNNATMIKQDNQTGLFRYFFIPETSGNYYIKVQYYNTSALLIERGQSIHIETSDEEKMFGLTIIIALIGIGMLFIYGSSHLKVDEVPTRRVPEKMLLYGLYLATVVSVAGALLVYVNNQAFASYFSVPANTIFIVVIGGVFAILCFYLIYVLEVMFRNKEQREDMDD